MIIGGRNFDPDRNTYIMGILNVTPDSFSDGGKYNSVDAALRQTERMINEGADIIDIGGESTRPGSEKVTAGGELSRVIPVLEAIKREFDIPVSIDTYKAVTAEEALRRGADFINDIWGLRYDDGEMARVIAKYDKPCVLMHNRKEPKYDNLIENVSFSIRTQAIKSIIHFCFLVNAICLFVLFLLTPH